jgi:hypothetical protein
MHLLQATLACFAITNLTAAYYDGVFKRLAARDLDERNYKNTILNAREFRECDFDGLRETLQRRTADRARGAYAQLVRELLVI